MLLVQQIEVFYAHVIQVLKGVSLSISEGQIICLLGANGAGKSTTLKAISGLLVAEDGRITDGAIEFEGKEPSPHRVLTVYRSAKNHPMGKKGYEIAFALHRDDNLVGWLIFQLNMESLSKQDDINARRLIELKFDRL